MYLGIDLSTCRQASMGKTQMALGEDFGVGLRVRVIRELQDDNLLLSVLTEEPFVRCGIDAPLSLPPCVLCRICPCDCSLAKWATLLGFSHDDVYHYRLSDLLVRKTVKGVGPKPPLSNGGPVDITPLTLRWLRLSRVLFEQGAPLERIVEVYATGTIQILAQALGLAQGRLYRYRSSQTRRAELLASLAECNWLAMDASLWERCISNEDSFDAVMACFSAFLAERRMILEPETLLGLVQPLQVGHSEVREEMLTALSCAPWVALPDPSKMPGNLEK